MNLKSFVILLCVAMLGSSAFAEMSKSLKRSTLDPCADIAQFDANHDNEVKMVTTRLSHYQPNCQGYGCVGMDALKKGAADSLGACHAQSMLLATQETGTCSYTRLKKPSGEKAFPRPVDFCSAMNRVESTPVVARFMAAMDQANLQSDCTGARLANKDTAALGKIMFDNEACAEAMSDNTQFYCSDLNASGKRFLGELSELLKLKAEQAIMNQAVDDTCTVKTFKELAAKSAVEKKLSTACLKEVVRSCKLLPPPVVPGIDTLYTDPKGNQLKGSLMLRPSTPQAGPAAPPAPGSDGKKAY